ncbi:MAG: hypothetical protein NT165_01155 [Candidatus Falkowbacteria bacterium]|nr:hypothetical protein [Candidatus Falkowbacteria bacterium]
MKIFLRQSKNSKGYITLLSVLIVGAVSIAITVSLILLGLSSSRTGLSYQQMFQAKNLAHSCAEEGLEKIRESSAFSGSGSISASQGSCTYLVTNLGGNSRTVDATGTVLTVIRRASVSVTAINPLIVVSSWQEM